MKRLNGIIFYMVAFIIIILSINFFIGKSAYINFEISNLKAYTFEIEKALETINLK